MARRSRAFWERVCSEFHASGQSLREFAASNALNRSTLSWWVSELRGDGIGPASGSRSRFLPVVIGRPVEARAVARGVVIVLRNGLEVRLELEELGELEALVQALERT